MLCFPQIGRILESNLFVFEVPWWELIFGMGLTWNTLGVKSSLIPECSDCCQFLPRLQEATRTKPTYTICVEHTQDLAGVLELWDKNISSVHLPYSAQAGKLVFYAGKFNL